MKTAKQVRLMPDGKFNIVVACCEHVPIDSKACCRLAKLVGQAMEIKVASTLEDAVVCPGAKIAFSFTVDVVDPDHFPGTLEGFERDGGIVIRLSKKTAPTLSNGS